MKRGVGRAYKRNKEGIMLLRFVIELIIAMICLFFLFLLISTIWSMFTQPKEKMMAREALDDLKQILSKVKIGEISKSPWRLYVPRGWWFVSIAKEYDEKSMSLLKKSIIVDMPKICEQTTCACICPEGKHTQGFLPGTRLDCSKGVCVTIQKPILEYYEGKFVKAQIHIAKPRDIYFIHKTEGYFITKIEEIMISPVSLTENELSTLNQIEQNYGAAIKGASQKYGIEAALVKAVILRESSGKWNEIGTSGEVGLMQIMPQNALVWDMKIYDPDNKIKNTPEKKRWEDSLMSNLKTDYHNKLIKMKDKPMSELIGIDDRFDPEKNIDKGTAYLADLYKKYNSVQLALIAYNWGPPRVDECLQKGGPDVCGIPADTKEYLAKVLSAVVKTGTEEEATS